jgi:hypothetical protein
VKKHRFRNKKRKYLKESMNCNEQKEEEEEDQRTI